MNIDLNDSSNSLNGAQNGTPRTPRPLQTSNGRNGTSGTPNIPQPVNGMIRTYEHSRRTFSRPYSAKTIFFYKEGDTLFSGVRIPVSKARYRTMDALLDDLSVKVPLPFGVRRVFTPTGKRQVQDVGQLQHLGQYICSSTKNTRGLNWNAVEKPNSWRKLAAATESQQPSPRKPVLGLRPNQSLPVIVDRAVKLSRSMDGGMVGGVGAGGVEINNGVRPVYFALNGSPERVYKKFLRLRFLSSLDDLLKEITDFLQVPIAKLYTQQAIRVTSVEDILQDKEKKFIACQRHEKPWTTSTTKLPQINATERKAAPKRFVRPRANSAPRTTGAVNGNAEVTKSLETSLPAIRITKRTRRTDTSKNNTYSLQPTKSTRRLKRKKAKEAEDLQRQYNDDNSVSVDSLSVPPTAQYTDHHHVAATKIQASYRGYRVRRLDQFRTPTQATTVNADVIDAQDEEELRQLEEDAAQNELDNVEPLEQVEDVQPREKSAVFKIEGENEEDDVELPTVASDPSFAASGPQSIPERCTYTVVVLTGNRWAADIDSDLYIILQGERGSTEKLWLKQNPKEPKFQQNALDAFEVDAEFVGSVQRITVGHLNKGYGAGIFLDRVLVSEGEVQFVQYVFLCNRWLDSGQVDGKIERTLNLLGSYDLKSVPQLLNDSSSNVNTPSTVSKARWLITLNNSTLESSGTTSNIYVTGYGSYGHSEQILLNDDSLQEPGKNATFEVNFGEIGDIFKVRFEIDPIGHSPDWLLYSADLRNLESAEYSQLICNRWLSPTMSTTKKPPQLFRELPVVRPGLEPLPIHQYQVKVLVNKMSCAKLPGRLQCQLAGEFGESGTISVDLSEQDENYSMMDATTDRRIQAYTFSLEAVSLGRLLYALFICEAEPDGYGISEGFQALQAIYDKHNLGFTAGNDWVVETAQIREDPHAPYQFVFSEGRVMQSETSNEIRKQMKLSNLEGLETKGRAAKRRSDAVWTVWATTGDHPDSGTDCTPFITIYGEKGKTRPLPLQAEGAAHVPGTTSEFTVEAKSVGQIYKIRIKLDTSSGTKPVWHLKKLKLKEQNSGEELRFPVEMWLEVSEETPDASVELPAVWPDVPPLPIVVYQVLVYTGKQKEPVKDIAPYIQIFGSKGDTGKRVLRKADHENAYASNAVARFDIECVSVEEIQKILVGLQASTTAASLINWHVEKIEIEDHDRNTVYTFLVKRAQQSVIFMFEQLPSEQLFDVAVHGERNQEHSRTDIDSEETSVNSTFEL